MLWKWRQRKICCLQFWQPCSQSSYIWDRRPSDTQQIHRYAHTKAANLFSKCWLGMVLLARPICCHLKGGTLSFHCTVISLRLFQGRGLHDEILMYCFMMAWSHRCTLADCVSIRAWCNLPEMWYVLHFKPISEDVSASRYDVFRRTVMEIPEVNKQDECFSVELHDPSTYQDPESSQGFWHDLQFISNLPVLQCQIGVEGGAHDVQVMIDSGIHPQSSHACPCSFWSRFIVVLSSLVLRVVLRDMLRLTCRQSQVTSIMSIASQSHLAPLMIIPTETCHQGMQF